MSKEQFTEQDWRRFLISLGEDPDRPGLAETPARVVGAWKHWTSGYAQDPADMLKVFEDGAEQYDELIVVKNIPVYSHCEHHLAPFFWYSNHRLCTKWENSRTIQTHPIG